MAPPPDEKSDILVPLLKDIQTKSELIEKLSQNFSNLTFEEARPIINELVYLKTFPLPSITERGEEIYLELFLKVSQPLELKIPRVMIFEQKNMEIKDYQKYLTNNFNYPMSQLGYQSLLIQTLKNYNRNQFKKIISHLLYFNSQINEEIIEYMSEICKTHRIGQTLYEFVYLLIENRINISPKSFRRVIDTLKNFKTVND